jgi:predicted aldo/keto reductase-like oxidoreductase
MNPLAGGKLAESTPQLKQLADEVGAMSVGELGLRFVLSNDNIDTIISGVARSSDADGSVAAASLPPFTPEQRAVIERRLADVDELSSGTCTACNYCRPCPADVDIPGVMSCLFDAETWGMTQNAARRHAELGEHNADACTACGECVPRCTQKLDIPERMRQAKALFSV